MPPTRSKFPLLQDPQKRHLRVGQEFTDFIEEKGATTANSKRPNFRWTAPVNAPFSCPNNSEAINVGASAAQLTLTNGPSDRRDRL